MAEKREHQPGDRALRLPSRLKISAFERFEDRLGWSGGIAVGASDRSPTTQRQSGQQMLIAPEEDGEPLGPCDFQGELELKEIATGELHPGEGRHPLQSGFHNLSSREGHASKGGDLVDEVRRLVPGIRDASVEVDKILDLPSPSEGGIHRRNRGHPDPRRVTSQLDRIGQGVGSDMSDDGEIRARRLDPGLQDAATLRDREGKRLPGRTTDVGGRCPCSSEVFQIGGNHVEPQRFAGIVQRRVDRRHRTPKHGDFLSSGAHARSLSQARASTSIACHPMIQPSKIGSTFAAVTAAVLLLAPFLLSSAVAAQEEVGAEAAVNQAAAVLDFDLDALPPLPGGEGLAGAVAGLDGHLIIVAGGANFPDSPRWETDKAWHDDIHVLDLTRMESGWTTFEGGLGGSIAYGVSVSHPTLGVVSIGGDTGQGITSEVFALRTGQSGGAPVRTDLPALPTPLAYAAGTIVGNDLYVFGGRSDSKGPATTAGWRLKIDADGDVVTWIDDLENERTWRPIKDLPGPARILPVAGELRGKLYCFSGVALEPDDGDGHRRVVPYLRDSWRYDPSTDEWMQVADSPRPTAAAPSPAIKVGWDMLAIVGGDDGALIDQIASLKDDHPGFPTGVIVYHPITDRWTERGDHPIDRDAGKSPPVTAATIAITGTETEYDGQTLIASGEIRPRTRTPRLALVQTLVVPAALGALDWTAIALYGVVLVWMGFFFSRRENSTDEYFLAGRRIPWWASGISIFATSLSAITFMAIPAKTWDTDWTYFIQNLLIIVVAPVAAMLLVPAFRRLDVTTAYEYLEHRFHASLRLAASALYMLFQVGRVAVVTLLPALALAAVTGLDVTTCIVVMGILCILYTALGGIEAVIWSDVLQAAVLFGGAGWALTIMLFGTEGGLSGLVEEASAAGKLRTVDVSFDLTRASLLVIVLGGIFSNIIPYASDQSVVQRYLAVKDVREAKRAVWAGALLALPASLLFFGLGTALWGFYRSNPELLRPTGQLDQILPLFIVDMLPAGVAGVVLAGLFAAAMSSLDSSMNSVATAFTTDWYRRFRPKADDRSRLVVARIATVTIGVLGTTAAIVMAKLNNSSLLDLWFEVLGLFGSGIAGVFLLGALTRRTGPIAGWCGLVASAVAVWSVSMFTDISGLTFAAVGIITCLATGFLVGIVDRRPAPQ